MPSPGRAWACSDVLAFFKGLIVVSLGVIFGLAATWAAVDRGLGFGAVHAGVWTAWPRTGAMDIDPYARAVIARTGEVPLGLAEGLMFFANHDDAGESFDMRCDYRVSGALPPARFWSLSVTTPDGHLVANSVGRFGVTSSSIVRGGEDGIDIALSRAVAPGNWVPLGESGRFVIVLSLFDSAVVATASALGKEQMPSVRRNRCA